MELTSLLTARTDDSHATPVNEFLNIIKITQLVFLIKKNLELTKNIIGYARTGKVLRVFSY